VSQQIGRKSIHACGEQAGRLAEQIAGPQKSDQQSDRGNQYHRNAAPEQDAIRIVLIEEPDSECILGNVLPVVARDVEPGMNEQQRKGCDQLRERRMFRVHSEIAGLPIAVTGGDMVRFVGGCGKFRQSQQPLKAEGQ
jgi:hypothetical protein